MSSDVILEFKGITKHFPGVLALNDINLDVRRGEILAIMGENGAGKSTLMKIAAGLYHPDRGSIFLNGTPVLIPDAQKALQLGIGMVPQELNLIPEMRVSENVLLGIEPRNSAGLVLRNKQRQQATEILASLDIDVDCDATVKDLSVAQQQMIQIARALANQCQILIMDEPTAALSHRETDLLLRKIRLLRDAGTTILYISHRIREVRAIADRVAVLRDGELVSVGQCADLTEDDITLQMIGRPLKEFLVNRETNHARGKPVLKVRNLSDTKHFHEISFELHEGEILGFAGLVGAGRSEVFSSVFGFRDFTQGEIWIDERKLDVRSPADAIRNGIGYVPEERKRQGLFLLLGSWKTSPCRS
ncbi:MAG: sugar ABC transporter ATP-binding protein [Chloroflexi bacterium]|nr:sugar ABC transporter ATP-binding protein [Chloroflexota bacterium]